MKQYLLLFLLIINFGTLFAQRIVYVDTDFILGQMNEYQEAQEELETITATWQEEIAQKEAELIQLRAAFAENELLMPEIKKIEEQNKLSQAEENLAALKSKRFGFKGDLFKKQQDLIKPLQDKVYNAIKQMAEYRDYDFVLDKSTGVSILFVKPKFDMSDEVLRILNN